MKSAQECFDIARSRTDSDLVKRFDAAIDAGKLALVRDGDKPDMIAGGSWPSRTMGARRAVCSQCGNYVGLSPQSGAAIADRFPDVPIVCYPCAVKRVGASA